MRNQSWPAVSKTGGMMFSAGAMFAAVGGLYSGVACVSEGVRGKAVLERRVRRPRRGTSDRDQGRSLGLGVGRRRVRRRLGGRGRRGVQVRGGGFDDGATPPRIYFPYKN